MQPQDIGERMGSYGLSLYLVLRPMIILGAFTTLAICVIKVVRDLPYSELEALIFTAAFVAPMLGTVLAAKSHCTVIHRDGLRMRDRFASYTPVPWLQMVRVQKIAVPLLPYLVVFERMAGGP